MLSLLSNKLSALFCSFFSQVVGLQDGRQSQRASFGFSSALVTASGLEVAGSVLPGAAWSWQGLGSLCDTCFPDSCLQLHHAQCKPFLWSSKTLAGIASLRCTKPVATRRREKRFYSSIDRNSMPDKSTSANLH